MPDFPATGTPADVWAYGTKALTDKDGFTISGTKQTLDALNDLAQAEVLSDATPFAGARIANTPAFEAQVETSIVMDGTEKVLVEKTDSKQSLLDGYADLTSMGASDTIVIRQYMKVKTGGDYIKYAEQSYSGTQTIPLLHIVTKTSKTSIKVTAEQTVKDGGYKTIDVQFFRRLTA